MLWVVIGGWLAGWVLLWRLPRLLEPAPPQQERRVSVIIPARNEADRLPNLLAGLCGQSRRPDQVIVVDDDSTDGTAATARSAPGVEVVSAPAVPVGWTGKSSACAAGATASDGDVLVFLDADVEVAVDALASLLSTWENGGGLVSVQPHHRIDRPVESLSLPFNVVAMMGLGVGSLLAPRREWGASGPCMVTARADYDRVGGHAAVAGAVAEDLALAERYAAAGLPLRCLGGGQRVRFRMYRGLRGIVEGWSKNLATGAGRTPVLRAVGIGWWVWSLLVLALWSWPFGGFTVGGFTVGGVAVAASYAAGAVQTALLGRQVGTFGIAALAWPVLFAFFVAVFVVSAARTVLFRRVRWSGRTVRLASRR